MIIKDYRILKLSILFLICCFIDFIKSNDDKSPSTELQSTEFISPLTSAKQYFLSYFFVLGILYLIICLASGFQIGRILYYKHSKTYQFFFLLLTFVWALSRTLFFLIFTQYTSIYSYVFYWTPIVLQFATFSLLVVFYAKLAHASKWHKWVRLATFSVYAIVNIVFTIIMLGVLIDLGVNDLHIKQSTNTFVQAFASVVFLVLSFILAMYGGYIYKLLVNEKIKQPFHLQGFASNKIIIFFTLIIVVIFTFRSVYDMIVAMFDVLTVNVTRTSLPFFILFVLWEITPAVLVLLLFWSVSKGNSRQIQYVQMPTDTNDYDSDVNENPDYTPSNLFMNDHRYDSDESEGDGLKKGDTPPLYGTPNNNIRYFSSNLGEDINPYPTSSPHSKYKTHV